MIKKKDLLRKIEELEKKNNNLIQTLGYRDTEKNKIINDFGSQLLDIEKKIKQITVILEHVVEKQEQIELENFIGDFGAILDKFFSKAEKNCKKCVKTEPKECKKCENEQKRGRGRPVGSKNKYNKRKGAKSDNE